MFSIPTTAPKLPSRPAGPPSAYPVGRLESGGVRRHHVADLLRHRFLPCSLASRLRLPDALSANLRCSGRSRRPDPEGDDDNLSAARGAPPGGPGSGAAGRGLTGPACSQPALLAALVGVDAAMSGATVITTAYVARAVRLRRSSEGRLVDPADGGARRRSWRSSARSGTVASATASTSSGSRSSPWPRRSRLRGLAAGRDAAQPASLHDPQRPHRDRPTARLRFLTRCA